MLKFLKRLIRSLLWFVILSLVILILSNILVAKYHEKVLLFFNIDKSVVSIRKVNSVFLPFFIDISNIYINSNVVAGEISSITVETNLKKIFDSGFLRIKIEGGDININFPKGESKGGLPLNFIDMFTVSDLKVRGGYQDYEVNGLLKYLSLSRSKFDADLKNVKISKVDFIDELDIQINGKIENNMFIISRLNANGENIHLSLNGVKKQNGKLSGGFSGEIRDKFLKLANPKLNGELVVSGDFVNDSIKAVVFTDNVSFDKNYFNGEIQVSKIGENIYFNSEGISYDKYFFIVDGLLNYKTSKVKTIFKEIKGVTYAVKDKSVDVKNVEVNGNYRDKIFFIKSDIKFLEDIVFKCTLLFKKQVSVQDVSLISNSLDVQGEGELTDGNKFNGLFKGNIKDNPYLLDVLKISHNLNFNINVEYDEKFSLKGVIRNNASMEYNNIKINQAVAEFNFDGNILSLNYVIKSDSGEVKGKGIVKRDDNTFFATSKGAYSLNLKNLKFNSIDDVSGRFDIKYDGKISGIVDAAAWYKGRQLEVRSVINNNTLTFKRVEIGENKYLNVGFVDLGNKDIKIQLKGKEFDDEFVHLVDLSLDINGKMDNPKIILSSQIYLKGIDKRIRVNANGDLNGLIFVGGNDELDIYSMVKVKEKIIHTTIKTSQLKYKNLDNITGTLLAKSEDFKEFEISGNFSGYVDNKYFEMREINATLKGADIVESSFLLDTHQINNVKVYNINVNSSSLIGEVDLSDAAILLDYLHHQSVKGDLQFKYDFKSKDISVEGNALLNGDIIVPAYGLNLRDVSVNFNLSGQQVYAGLSCDYLDMVLIGSYFAPSFKDILKGTGYIRYNNVFVNAANFSGTVRGNLNYTNELLYGDIIILKGEYAFKEFKKRSNNKKLPLKIDIDIQTESPIKTLNKFSKSNLNAKLKLRYDNGLSVTGFMEAKDSSLTIGGEKFNITQGELTLSEQKPPYLYFFARGTNRFRDILLEIKGFLPEYTISIRDISPAGTGFGNLKTSGEPGANLIQGLFNGEAFGNILSFTNKFFGINNLGIEGGYQNLGYFSIGRTFTDRLTIKYRIKGGEKGDDIVGEYTIFDWLNFNILSQNNGSSGAGFSIYYSF
ncbi:hypothetical protein DSN97_05365 [Deferribacteraceae bacterium V6Fe1]|nr:hypothetical protein DSN97_05365 [Deferribacteraceae bacterium V6Fe1]